jgi:hypothetical protein
MAAGVEVDRAVRDRPQRDDYAARPQGRQLAPRDSGFALPHLVRQGGLLPGGRHFNGIRDAAFGVLGQPSSALTDFGARG